jgi:nicotinate-nucleotide adenylyltransferase
MRLGIFGGTFDPVHYGHLLLAELCREACRLDRVWFVPAAVAPHKTTQPVTPPEHRLEMLQLAIGGHEAFEICRLEIDRGGVNYTYQTLEHIARQHPQHERFLLLGGDSLDELPAWRHPERICQLATLVAVRRPGYPPPDWSRLAGLAPPERLQHFARHEVVMPLVGISSTDLRQRVAAGRTIRYQTPRAVEKYIQAHGLYRLQAAPVD